MFFLKVDANNKIGGGHLMRSLTLANEIKKRNINAEFIISDSSYITINDVETLGFKVHIIPIDKQFEPKYYFDFISENSIIIFDTDDYRFHSGNLINELHKKNIKSACFTITDDYYISTHFLINPNIVSAIHDYNTSDYTQKLLGPQYMVLRDEFRNINITKKNITPPFNILIMFGNADINNLTVHILNALKKIQYYCKKLVIVTGNLNENIFSIKNKLNEFNLLETELYINTHDMISIYNDIDIAITSASIAMWEMAIFGIPQFVIPASEREEKYTDYIESLNFILKISSFKNIDSEDVLSVKLSNFFDNNIWSFIKSQEFKKIIDAFGAKRIIDKLLI